VADQLALDAPLALAQAALEPGVGTPPGEEDGLAQGQQALDMALR
jgi:hypothetical protein